MRLRVQVVIESDDDADHQAPDVHEVTQIDRHALSVDTLGLQLDEAKHLLQKVQSVLIDEQVRTSLAEQVVCPDCGRPRAHKDTKTIVTRTLFGTLHLRSPRWHQCPCQPQTTRTFSPLAAALPERTTPELLYLESKFAGLVSYGLSARWLAETLPIGRPLYASGVRLHAQATGERLESELRSRAVDVCRRLPTGLGRTATPRLAADGRPGWRLRAFQPAAFTPRRLVRSHRRQEHAHRRLGQVLWLRPDVRHQAQATLVRGAEVPGD